MRKKVKTNFGGERQFCGGNVVRKICPRLVEYVVLK